MVTYYQRKATSAILFFIAGIMFLISSALSFSMGDKETASMQLLVFLLFSFDAYIYRKPYLGLSEEKLIISNGLFKKEILLKDITLLEESKKKLKINHVHGSKTKKSNVMLSMLKPKHRDDFMKTLLGSKGLQCSHMSLK